MKSVASLLPRCSVQRSTPAGWTRFPSSYLNNKADPAHCRAFVLLIFLTVILSFLLVAGLFRPYGVVGKHRAVLTVTPKQRR